MSNIVGRVPTHIVRLVIIILALLALTGFTVYFVIPPSLMDKTLHRQRTFERELRRNVMFAGATSCVECHEEVFEEKSVGFHKNIACESCHGALFLHAEEPEDVDVRLPKVRSLCVHCHEYNHARPTGFPQISLISHYPLERCNKCHTPHDPATEEEPHDCTACHGSIARTKESSSHALLECTTCHETPDAHKLTPRTIRPSKPNESKACGKCHGPGSTEKKAPKVDMNTHGERYVCWQCHYAHMPTLEEAEISQWKDGHL